MNPNHWVPPSEHMQNPLPMCLGWPGGILQPWAMGHSLHGRHPQDKGKVQFGGKTACHGCVGRTFGTFKGPTPFKNMLGRLAELGAHKAGFGGHALAPHVGHFPQCTPPLVSVWCENTPQHFNVLIGASLAHC